MGIQKRAQAATEYLIILAVVIVIALVVVVAMGKFPGIGKSTVGRSSAAYWSTQDVAITDFAVSEGGDDTFVVKNNMRNPVTINTFNIGGKNLSETSGGQKTIGPGGSATYTGTVATDLTCFAGQSFVFSVSVTYTDSNTGATYDFTGEGMKLEGTCAN
ncbi:hypothetical protein JXB31_00205 [Candidatus Woesearchaeota archaeon]|nr:hypothetical protein [Candidatus Woesearchaeota archaeon]